MRLLLLSVLFNVSFLYINAITIHVQQESKFKHTHVPTELTAYKLLQQLASSDDIHHVAIPWDILTDTGKLSTVKRKKINAKKVFSVCQNIHFDTHIIPILVKMGVKTLFTPHATKKEIQGITIIPFPHYPANGIDPAENKDILYSFIGCSWTHKTRKRIFKMEHPENTVIVERKQWHYKESLAEKEKHKKHYTDTLSRSRFSLCPRGTGPGTFRFWESLQAGAIPVLIADRLRLPNGFDWENTIIRVPEKDVEKIPGIIATISAEQENLMREKCLEAFDHFCRGNNFIKAIEEYYEALEQ